MDRFKKKITIGMISLALMTIVSTQPTEAAVPAAILKVIQEGVRKVIKAIDLKVQRQQNRVIALQNAQKVIESKLSELKLKEIADWIERQRQLYKEYFDELWKVKNAISSYKRIKEIMDKQIRLVEAYKRAWNLVNQDKNFTKSEIDYMYRVYSGILDESVKNLDQILLVVNSFKTQMTDGKRLEIINAAGEGINRNYSDLQEFNAQNIRLSLNRAKDTQEVETVKKLYGL